MGGQYKWLSVSPQEIIDALDSEAGKKFASIILDALLSNGLTYKVKTQWKAKNSTDRDGYVVYGYIKKSKEAFILNTRYFSISIRIKDLSTFEKLDVYSENIRNAILINSKPCRAPYCSNDGSEYVFNYHGKEYRLCHMICDNFKFRNITDDDIDSLIDIINREIAYDMPKRKNKLI